MIAMLKMVVALLALVACSDTVEVGPDGEPITPITDPDLHEHVTCGDSWQTSPRQTDRDNDYCEAACAEYHPSPAVSGPIGCQASYETPEGAGVKGCTAESLFEFQGVMGCCVQKLNPEIRQIFAVCNDQL